MAFGIEIPHHTHHIIVYCLGSPNFDRYTSPVDSLREFWHSDQELLAVSQPVREEGIREYHEIRPANTHRSILWSQSPFRHVMFSEFKALDTSGL
jgi:hypothetical protein